MLPKRRQRTFNSEWTLQFSETSKAKAASPKTPDSFQVVGLGQDSKGWKPALQALSDDTTNLAKRLESEWNFSGKFGEIFFGAGNVIFVGLGKKPDITPRAWLHLGAKIAHYADKHSFYKLSFDVDSFFPASAKRQVPEDFAGRPMFARALTREEALERLVVGFIMGSYEVPSLKHEEKTVPKHELHFVSRSLLKKVGDKILVDAKSKAEAVYWIRDEANLPPNLLYPETFARDIRTLGEAAGLKVRVLDDKLLQKEGFGGIWSVGKGSNVLPRLAILEHNANSKNLPHLVLVGKGVTFDTGGYSIKPHFGMELMKHDMTGAAIAAAVSAWIVREKIPLRLSCLLPLAENKVSSTAQVPGDVYTAWGGQSVEVNNTDAEGRLILSDCLAYASALQADLIIDLATLTGAASVTLGPVGYLVYGNRHAWTKKISEASRRAGEECWEMPLFAEYKEDLQSDVADIRNIPGHRDGNSSVAAQFLHHFVNEKCPWIHLDICSYATSNKWKGAHCSTVTNPGLPSLALMEFVKNYFVAR